MATEVVDLVDLKPMRRRPAAHDLTERPGTLKRIRGSSWVLVGWLAVATLLAGGLRFYNLGRASFWEDELKTVLDSSRLEQLHRTKLFGYVPTALGIWAFGPKPSEIPAEHPERWQALGITEFSARWVSAAIGVVSVPVLALASVPLIGRRAAVMLAILLAVAPWHIYWSQASRFYTQQFLFYNLALIWYFLATRDGSTRLFAAAVVCGLLAFLSQPPALVLLAVLGLDWAMGRLRGEPVGLRAKWLAMAAAGLGAFGLMLVYDVLRAPKAWGGFVGSMYQSPLNLVLGTGFMVVVTIAAFALMSGWWLRSTQPRLGIYLLMGALVPLAVLCVMSWRNYVGLRYAMVTLYCWLALAAVGCAVLYDMLRPRVGRVLAGAPAAVLLLSCVPMMHGYYTSGAGFHTMWREAFAYVAQRRQAGERVYSEIYPGRYYLQDGTVQMIPKAEAELVQAGQPAWLVVEMQDALLTSKKRFGWIEESADLKTYFDLKVSQPFSSVRVYHWTPR